jgi:LysR family transcriptional regulator, benzoate and cis,cis-muconate-responsive activator of ben and cat genes
MDDNRLRRVPSAPQAGADAGDETSESAPVLAEGVELRLLEVFVAVAEELHFGRAARRLGVAQPPVSRSIQTLEARLGVPLFVRSSRSVELSRAGEILLSSSRELLSRHRELLAAMSTLRLEPDIEPVLSVAVDPGIAGGIVTAALREFSVWFPRARVQLSSISHGADGLAVSRDADLALVCADSATTGDRELDRYIVCSEDVGAVVAADHPASTTERLTLAELSHEPQLKALYGSAHWRAGLSVAGLTGLSLDWAAGYDNFADGLDLVAGGRGIMLVPRLAWEHCERADLRWIPVPEAGTVALMVAWRPGRSTRSARALAKFVVEGARLRRIDNQQRTGSSSGQRLDRPGAAPSTA